MTTKFILENCKNIAGWEELNPSQRSQIMFFAEMVHANGVMVGKETVECPPHNLVDYVYQGTWGASVPPPNKRCTKCLMTERF